MSANVPDINAPGPRLPAATLGLASALPAKPAEVELHGQGITLRPVRLPDDATSLHPLTDGSRIELPGFVFPAYDPDALVWRFLFDGPFTEAEQLIAYLEAQATATDRTTFAIVHDDWRRTVGVLSLAANAQQHLRIEIGGICLSPAVQGRGVLKQSIGLCLSHLFGIGYRRVEWKCDDRNERSKRAAVGLGFQPEGVQEQHMIVKGHNRDTAWFRILDSEWPGLLEGRYS